MAEVFDNDLRNELKKHDEVRCSNCGYEGEQWEWDEKDGDCPMCYHSIINENDEYNPDESKRNINN